MVTTTMEMPLLIDLPGEPTRRLPLDGLAERFIALLDLPSADSEVQDIAAMLQEALALALETDQSEPLDDALRFAHGRLRVRGLNRAGIRELGDALADAAAVPLAKKERVHLHALLARCGADLPPSQPSTTSALGALVSAYVGHLVEGDRKGAVELTRQCVIDGMDMFEILLDVLEPAQHEVGRLWELGRISVAQEHFCTAVTEFVMTGLYPGFFTGEESRRRLVAVHVPGSTHRLGLRMVTDILECRDWHTAYVAEDVTAESLPGLVAAERADLLLISASMPSHIDDVRTMIEAIRHDRATDGVKVVVGGRPFAIAPDLVQSVGADGWAPDGRAAVEVCSALVAQP